MTTRSADHLQGAQYDEVAELGPDLTAGHHHLQTWGTEDAVAERLGAAADEVASRRAVLTRTCPTVEAGWADRARTASPVVTREAAHDVRTVRAAR